MSATHLFAEERDGLDVFNSGGRRVRRVEVAAVKLGAPAVVLTDPKYRHNVGQAVRLCSCYGVASLIITGTRVRLDDTGVRLPREERMRGYADVNLYQYERPFELFDDVTFVAVEVRENAEPLPSFEHPARAVYVFGPEDGSLGRATLGQCHRFVVIPTRHCLNLATSVGTVLYDRQMKLGGPNA
jgi:tRNA(Leu) C34 or U34 (ribose-2'-O)-methylase TrmL